MSYFARSPEVIKGLIFLKFTLLLIQELVNNFVMYNRLKGTNKQYLTSKSRTSEGHCKVKGQVQDHISLWHLFAKLLVRATHWCILYEVIWSLLIIMANFMREWAVDLLLDFITLCSPLGLKSLRSGIWSPPGSCLLIIVSLCCILIHCTLYTITVSTFN